MIIIHFSMKRETDFFHGLDTLVQYIAEKDKAEEISFQIFESKTKEKNSLHELIINVLSKLKFKWNSMVSDPETKRFIDLYRIKLMAESQEDYTKKIWYSYFCRKE